MKVLERCCLKTAIKRLSAARWQQVASTPPLRSGRKRCGPRTKARCLGHRQQFCGRETKENKVRAYSLNELFYLTRDQLFALHAQIAVELDALPDDSPDRPVALQNLRNIRRVLGRPHHQPG